MEVPRSIANPGTAPEPEDVRPDVDSQFVHMAAAYMHKLGRIPGPEANETPWWQKFQPSGGGPADLPTEAPREDKLLPNQQDPAKPLAPYGDPFPSPKPYKLRFRGYA